MRAIARLTELVRYAVTTAGVNFWRHRTMSLAAVFAAAVMMLMLNGFVIVVTNLNVALGALEQKVNVIGYIKDDAPAVEVTRLQERLRANPLVADVTFLSKEDAMTRLKQQLVDRKELLDMVTGNPLPASVEVRLKDGNKINELATQLRKETAVEDVTLQQDVVDNLLRITNFARAAGLVMVIGLMGITLFVIVNTIRLAVYARRQEIEIMKLVGATDWFIRWPFVLEGVLCGLLGALLTSALVGAAYEPMQLQFLSLVQFLPVNLDASFPLRLAGLTAAVGVSIGAAGSFISVRRFLDV